MARTQKEQVRAALYTALQHTGVSVNSEQLEMLLTSLEEQGWALIREGDDEEG